MELYRQCGILRNSAFNADLHFSHIKVFNNDHNSYTKIGVKRLQA